MTTIRLLRIVIVMDMVLHARVATKGTARMPKKAKRRKPTRTTTRGSRKTISNRRLLTLLHSSSLLFCGCRLHLATLLPVEDLRIERIAWPPGFQASSILQAVRAL
jgi:hypothetical protein